MTAASVKLSAQNAFITFTADRNCEVSLYESIDSVNNTYVPTKILPLQKDKPITCRTAISSFAFINYESSHGSKCKLLLAPDGKILHKDLPRPSELLKLKKELDKIISSKVIPT